MVKYDLNLFLDSARLLCEWDVWNYVQHSWRCNYSHQQRCKVGWKSYRGNGISPAPC